MTVAELIKRLEKEPQNYDVKMYSFCDTDTIWLKVEGQNPDSGHWEAWDVLDTDEL